MGVRKLLLQHGADPTPKDNPRNDFPMKGFDARDSIKSDMINLQKGNLDLPVEENEPSF